MHARATANFEMLMSFKHTSHDRKYQVLGPGLPIPGGYGLSLSGHINTGLSSGMACVALERVVQSAAAQVLHMRLCLSERGDVYTYEPAVAVDLP